MDWVGFEPTTSAKTLVCRLSVEGWLLLPSQHHYCSSARTLENEQVVILNLVVILIERLHRIKENGRRNNIVLHFSSDCRNNRNNGRLWLINNISSSCIGICC